MVDSSEFDDISEKKWNQIVEWAANNHPSGSGLDKLREEIVQLEIECVYDPIAIIREHFREEMYAMSFKELIETQSDHEDGSFLADLFGGWDELAAKMTASGFNFKPREE